MSVGYITQPVPIFPDIIQTMLHDLEEYICKVIPPLHQTHPLTITVNDASLPQVVFLYWNPENESYTSDYIQLLKRHCHVCEKYFRDPLLEFVLPKSTTPHEETELTTTRLCPGCARSFVFDLNDNLRARFKNYKPV